jgi:hypothetical protein
MSFRHWSRPRSIFPWLIAIVILLAAAAFLWILYRTAFLP